MLPETKEIKTPYGTIVISVPREETKPKSAGIVSLNNVLNELNDELLEQLDVLIKENNEKGDYEYMANKEDKKMAETEYFEQKVNDARKELANATSDLELHKLRQVAPELKTKHLPELGEEDAVAEKPNGGVVVYFASGWFDEIQLHDMSLAMEALKWNPMLSPDSFFPFENQNSELEPDTIEWAHQQYKMDVEHMKQADVFVVNISEDSQDIGSATEQGWAIAHNKPIIFVSNEAKGINLMNAMGNTYSTTNPEELATINLKNIPANFWNGSFI